MTVQLKIRISRNPFEANNLRPPHGDSPQKATGLGDFDLKKTQFLVFIGLIESTDTHFSSPPSADYYETPAAA